MFKNLPPAVIEEILEQIQVGLTFVDNNSNVVYFNKLAGDLLLWDRNKEWNNSVPQCHPPSIHKKVIDKLNTSTDEKMWHRIIKIKGRYVENIYSRIDIPGVIQGVMIVTRDVTHREENNRIIRKSAVTDSMTGLYNRKHFSKVYNDLLERSNPFGVIMLDVNGLKYVNDNCGHEAGDKLIIQAAETISRSVRTTDIVFRFGGDEFLVLVPEGNEEDLQKICSRIKSKNHIPSPDCPVGLNLSVGYCSSSSVDNPEDTLNCADEKMYEDKRAFYENEGSILKRGQ